jgi:6-phosphogluconate dehydrogenase
MARKDKSAYEYIKPIITSLSKTHGGHDYFGPGGAGNFVKMVHNGIEYRINKLRISLLMSLIGT